MPVASVILRPALKKIFPLELLTKAALMKISPWAPAAFNVRLLDIVLGMVKPGAAIVIEPFPLPGAYAESMTTLHIPRFVIRLVVFTFAELALGV